ALLCAMRSGVEGFVAFQRKWTAPATPALWERPPAANLPVIARIRGRRPLPRFGASPITIAASSPETADAHDRVLLRLLEPVDLSRVREHPTPRRARRRGNDLEADPRRRGVQRGESERVPEPGEPGA